MSGPGPEFNVTGTLQSQGQVRLYKAIDLRDGTEVVIKTGSGQNDIHLSERLQREFEISRALEHPGLQRVRGLVDFEGKQALVIEYINAGRLSDREGEAWEIERFLKLASKMAEAVSFMHGQGVVHLQICPPNFLYDDRKETSALMNFTAAEYHGYSGTEKSHSDFDEVMLHYISPEHTGRVDHMVDHRSDIYSLGATYYRLLAGKHALHSEDTSQLIHQHIAVKPDHLCMINRLVPRTLGDIIMKMLEKDPTDRYQSAGGLKSDLEKCLKSLELTGEVEAFTLAQEDIQTGFRIPSSPVGREEEIQSMIDLLGKIKTQSSFLAISGLAGSGKSFLVDELYRASLESEINFVKGKFDQIDRGIPYFALFEAFSAFAENILKHSAERREAWKQKILKALGPNGRLITDSVPELALILGDLPRVDEVQPQESQNRFNRVLGNFVKAMGDSKSPLVLFLDDMQWADSASLKFLQDISKEKIKGLLIVFAYRDNEVEPGPFTALLDDVRKAKRLTEIHVEALTVESIQELLAKTLKLRQEDTRALAELLMRVTEGNPLLVVQTMLTLHEQRLFRLNAESGSWLFNLKEIQAVDVLDAAADLIVQKLERLDPVVQEVLSTAAAVGNKFDTRLLSKVGGRTETSTMQLLKSAIDKGIIHPLDNHYKYLLRMGNGIEELPVAHFKFTHDKMQTASYQLAKEAKQKHNHLSIGRAMFKDYSTSEVRVFDMVNQFSNCLSLVTDNQERRELADFFVEAADRAKASNAFDLGLEHYLSAAKLVESAYDSRLEHRIFLNAGECAYLSGDFNMSDNVLKRAAKAAQTEYEHASVHAAYVVMHNLAGNIAKSWDSGLKGLKLLGVNVSKKTSTLSLLVQIIVTKMKLGKRTPDDILAMPDATEPEPILAHTIIAQLLSSAFSQSAELLAVLLLKSLQLTLKFGLNPMSFVGISGYGAIMGVGFGKYKMGWDFVSSSTRLMEKYDSNFYTGRGLYGVYGNYCHYILPLQETIDPLDRAVQLGVESGDFLNAGYTFFSGSGHRMFLPMGLQENLAHVRKGRDLMVKLRFDNIEHGLNCMIHAVELLSVGDNAEFEVGERKYNDEMASIDLTAVSAQSRLQKLKSLVYLGQFDSANKIADEISREQHALTPSAIEVEYVVFRALALLGKYSSMTAQEQKSAKRSIRKSVKLSGKFAKICPANHKHLEMILKARVCQILENAADAGVMYRELIEYVSNNGFTQYEALGHEYLAELYHGLELSDEAQKHWDQAKTKYQAWGAYAKSKQLSDLLEHLFDHSSSSDSDVFSALDTRHVLKAARVLSESANLSDLVSQLMELTLQHTGADKGMLILMDEGELKIAARANFRGVQMFEHGMEMGPAELPESIINQVSVRKNFITVNDPQNDQSYSKDPYVIEARPRSIMCSPLVKQGKLIGIMYVENSLSTNVFTEDRIELVNVLTAQAAISIENLRQYSNMLELHQAYERFVPKEFLKYLEKESITDVELGSQIEREMTILFSDIRGFTALSESMTPQENFAFINDYLSAMEPVITDNNGFIDKYIGDAIMALFPYNADDAIACSIDMIRKLDEFNVGRDKPVAIGIGLNTGQVMLGTVGGKNRMDGTVISDSVNMSARVEGMTKKYGAALLITDNTYNLISKDKYTIRKLDVVVAKGKSEPMAIYEVCDVYDEHRLRSLEQSIPLFHKALDLYFGGDFTKALEGFESVHAQLGKDVSAELYIEKCKEYIKHGAPKDWDGVNVMREK